MKKNWFFGLFILLNCTSFAQKPKPSTLEVINFNSKFITYFTNGEKEDFGQDMKIAFFKDYILFEKPTIHFKAGTIEIDLDNTKEGDTIFDVSEPDTTIEKITRTYYIYKHGQKGGLFYGEEMNSAKPFYVDTLFADSNLGKLNEEGLSADLGKPKEEKRAGKKLLEKYWGFKNEDGIDTIFRHYDEALKSINFSLSKKLDEEKQSKLVKSLYLIKYKNSLAADKPEMFKFEIVSEIELITKECSKVELDKFAAFFDKYKQDSEALKIN